MITENFFKYLLVNDAALDKYYTKCSAVNLDDIKRSLLLLERNSNVSIPDHYYRLSLEKSFENIDHLSQIFTKGLFRLAYEHLELYNDTVYVKADKMNDWQMVVPYCPPLLLDSLMIFFYCKINVKDSIASLERFLKPNFRYTSIPTCRIPQMEHIRQERGGLYDLHIHLNGTIESDLVWQDLLSLPNEAYKEIKKASKNPKVKEMYQQISRFTDAEIIKDLLPIATRLRYLISCIIRGVTMKGMPNMTFNQLLEKIKSGDRLKNITLKDSVIEYNSYPLYEECFFYMQVFDHLVKNKYDDTLAGLFYYYLLVFGLVNRMLVQQPDMFGFDEFQKYTSNGFREWSEQKYNRRFFQLAGNDLRNIKFLEGRFPPKNSITDDIFAIDNIAKGWERLQKNQNKEEINPARLKLIAHFIKKPDKNRDGFVRFKNFRIELRHKTDFLGQLINSRNSYSKYLTGVDAAASEFDTPPEVFAPSYRRLREMGIVHFTYHAGEDFYHILSGLRAVYEAITFLDLRQGDRIGHAVATGISPELWRNNIGPKLLIRQGEYMDDLVFSYYLINNKRNSSLRSFLPTLAIKIEEYGCEIYKAHHSVEEYIEAWKLRKENPLSLISQKEIDSKYSLFLQYHSKSVDTDYNKIIKVDTFDLFDAKELQLLQLLLLEYMHDKEIVIETLPTSNVFIGHHHNFSTYHLYNWYKWAKEGHPLPPIVVGTDDAGIFSTNIYNEYCNIYCDLVYDKKMNTTEVVHFIEDLYRNSEVYAFR